MHYVLDARDVELSVEPCPPSDVRGRVREFRASLVHPYCRVAAHVLELDGVSVVRGRHDASRDLVMHLDEEPQLVFHVGLRGHPTAQIEGVPGFLSHEPHTTDLAFTPATRTTFTIDRGASNEAFEINFTAPSLTAWALRYPELLEGVAERVGRARPFRDSRRGAVAPQQLLRAVDAVMTSARHGSLRAAFVEARIVELLVHHLGAPEVDAPRARVRDLDRVMEARDRLLARLGDPPTIPELARAVGTNAFRLKREFKATFGEGVGAFVVSRRLELARTLLRDTNTPIKAIAAEVGYSDVAHFSTAFKRRYGVPPSHLRPSVPRPTLR